MEDKHIQWILWVVVAALVAAIFWHYGRKKA
jgi:hypothetical protein